jgi:streptogramin lyase
LRRLIALCLAVAAVCTFRGGTATAGLPPNVSQPRVIALAGGPLTLSGANFGLPVQTRSLRFDYAGGPTLVPSNSPYISQWSSTSITLTVPPSARTGTVTVIVDGQPGNAVPAEIFMLTRTSTVSASAPNANPLTLAIDAASSAWVLDEFHGPLERVTPGDPDALSAVNIPLPGPIFAYNVNQDIASATSILGEDVDVASDGGIWFTQGGAYLYSGAQHNASRIIRYDPTNGTFACYNVPIDSAEVFGVLIDEARGRVWYAEGSLDHGNAISYFTLGGAVSECNVDPASAPPPICAQLPVPSCHRRYPIPTAGAGAAHLTLDGDGRVWFTEFWKNRIGRLDPLTGAIMELPLPAPIVASGPGTDVGSGPFEITADENGDIVFVESFDATVSRVNRALADTGACTSLDAFGRNPCVDELYVGTNGVDGAFIHDVSLGRDGRLWFGVTGEAFGLFATIVTDPVTPLVGFISPDDNDAVVTMPMPNADSGGAFQDTLTGDVWVLEYRNRSVYRLTPATGDADGIAPSIDNCPGDFNPMQENADANFIDQTPPKQVDDLTRAMSDQQGDACDTDDDNDGLSDSTELAVPCAAATAASDPLKADTDGDRIIDGAECALGFDPLSAASKPPAILQPDSDGDGLPNALDPAPTVRDADGDRLNDGLEYRGYGTSPLLTNSDGDACGDAREVMSVNRDLNVNAIDLALVASEFGGSLANFDVNKDASVNAIDLALVASLFGPC